jgi:hypothetical protein
MLLKLFQKIQREGTLLNSFYEVSIILILKVDKDTTKKENYRPILLTNIRLLFKYLQIKYLQTKFNKHQKIIYHDQVCFIPGLIYIN